MGLIHFKGNHHLFLYCKTQSEQEWIVLLGKRKRHFPFFGTRFENATFYNVTEGKLYHHSEEEMTPLHFDCGHRWKISGEKPFDFKFTFVPTFLKKRWIFFGTSFRYHLVNLFFQEGSIRGEQLDFAYGISEQGKMPVFSLRALEMPFDYTLFLEEAGKGGLIQWKAKIALIKDRFSWGNFPADFSRFHPKQLAQTEIPLKDWTLKREIVRVQTAQNQVWYGLKESFHK